MEGIFQLPGLNVLNWQLTSVSTSFSYAFLYCRAVKLKIASPSLAARVLDASEIPRLGASV